MAARGGLLAALACSGCTDEADARAQLVVVIDVNAPVVEQLADPAVSPAAAIDTLRIEVLDEHAQVIDSRTLLVPGVASWPVSFGSVSPEGGRVLLRLRAYRAAFAALGSMTGEVEPVSEITVDRLVELEPPAEGVRAAHVLLDSSCLGVAPTWGEPWQTCVAADALSVLPTEGVRYADRAEVVSAVGTWPGARELPCLGQERGKCIAGGFSVLGDQALAALETLLTLPPVPLRPVLLSPFWMDETEFTVGQFEELVTAGLVQEHPFPWREDIPVQDECTWRSHKPDLELLPVNCITRTAAQAACEAVGGSLPTEAQWEHAARGRGRAWNSPWGNEPGVCCSASIAQTAGCDQIGIEPAGSHRPSDDCPVGDESLDQVLDLAGSVTELVQDAWLPYDAPCWSLAGGPLQDPVCLDPEGEQAARGGSYLTGFGLMLSAMRLRAFIGAGVADEQVGFRCVYEDRP